MFATLVQPDEPTPAFFQDLNLQFTMLLEWATDKLMFDEIAGALIEEHVVLPEENQQPEILVDVKALELMNNRDSKDDQNWSSLTKRWLELCRVVLRVRLLYNDKDWIVLHTFLAAEYSAHLSRMEEASAGVASQLEVVRVLQEEHQNCHQVANFHLISDELKTACKTHVFSLIDVDNMHTSVKDVLQNSMNGQTDIVLRAKEVNRSFTPEFPLLLELVDLSTQLRLRVMEGKLRESKELVKVLKGHKVLELVPKYSTELDSCVELLHIYDKEEVLVNNLKKVQIGWTVYRNESLQYSSIQITCTTNAKADISLLETACEDVKQLRRCPQAISQQAKVTQQYLVDARKLSLEIHQEDCETGGPTLLPCLVGATTAGRSTRHELATANNLKECIESFEKALPTLRTVLFSENMTEIDSLLLDLQRRHLAYQFHDVVTTKRSVQGKVGHLSVDNESCSTSVKLFADVSSVLNSFRSLVKSNDAAVLTELELQKLHPSDKSRGFHNLFLNHLDPLISVAERIISLREAVFKDDWKDVQVVLDEIQEQKVSLSSQKTTGNRSYFNTVFLSMMTANEEIFLVQTENDHNKLIISLRDAVDNLEVDFIDPTAPILTFNPDPSTIRWSRLDLIRSKASTIGCHSNESMTLLKMVNSLIAMLTLLCEGKRDEICHDDMLRTYETITTHLQLTGSQLYAILHYIKMSQVIKTFYETAINTSNHETKALYTVMQDFNSRKKTTKANSKVSAELRQDLKPWIRHMEDLRQLRLLRRNEDWLGVVERVDSAGGLDSVTSGGDHSAQGPDALQVTFLKYLKAQRDEAYQEAKAHEVAAQFDIASSTGMVGSKGVASLFIPELGIGMLRDMIQKSTAGSKHYTSLPEAQQQQQQLASLLVMRECALRESNTCESEKAKDSEYPTLGKQQSPSTLAARAKTNDAIIKSASFFEDECKFVSETSSLLQLVENTEFAILKPVVSWERASMDALYESSPDKDNARVRLNSFDHTTNFSDEGQVEINVENVVFQKKAVLQIQTAFPDKYEEIPLVTITNSLHEILATAEVVADYGALEDKLRSFNILVEVLDLPPHVKMCLESQVLVFQKGHMLDQLTSLVTEGSELLSSHCYNKAILDEYLDKITVLTITAGEKTLPEDISSCIKCMRCCRDLILASDFLLSSEFAKYRKELDVVSAQAPEWFYDLLGRWVGKLHDPSVSTAGFLEDAERSLLSRQESATSGSSVVLTGSGSGSGRGGRGRREDSSVSLCLQEIGLYIQHMMKVKSHATDLSPEVTESEFDQLHKPFDVWKERYNLLNLTWTGFQCIKEDIPVSQLHLQSFSQVLHTPYMSIFHTDTYTLSLICSLLKVALEKEPNLQFGNAMSQMEQNFLNIVNMCEAYVSQGKSKESQRESKKNKGEREPSIYYSMDFGDQLMHVENTMSFCTSLTEALIAVDTALTVLEEMAGIRVTRRLKDKESSSSSSSGSSKAYFNITAQVNSEENILFSIHSTAKDWNVDVECCPTLLLALCSSGDSKKNKFMHTELAELFQVMVTECHGKSSSPFNFAHDSSTTQTMYLVQAGIISASGKRDINICNSVSNKQVTVSCSPEVFAACLIDSSFLVKMIFVGAEELRKSWKDGIDPSLSALIQDTLGPHNACVGNTSLKQLIVGAKEAVSKQRCNIEYTSRMLLVSQSGYNLFQFSPWHFQWIDNFIAEKNMQLVSANMPEASVIGEVGHTMLSQMLKSHKFLKSEVETLCGSAHEFQENAMDILTLDISKCKKVSQGHKERQHQMKEWLDCSEGSIDSPADSLWKFNKKVAQFSIERYFPSQGVFCDFVRLVRGLVLSIAPPSSLRFFSHDENDPDKGMSKDEGKNNANTEDLSSCNENIHSQIQAFITRISTSVMHPLVTFIILCTQELHFVSMIIKKTQDVSSTVDESILALEMLSHGSHFVDSFGEHLSTLIRHFREACSGDEGQEAALELITSLEDSFEELVCKLEGLCRLKLVHDGFVNAAVNRKSIMLTNSLDKTKTTASFRKTSAIAVINKTVSLAFKNKKIMTANAASGQKAFLKPLVSESWMESLEAEGTALDDFFSLRSLTAAWSATDDSSTVSINEEDQGNDQNSEDFVEMKSEAELLIPLSAIIVKIPNLNIRSHLLKELGVVSLRHSRLDLDDKISEIIMLVKMCGCDIRALHLGLHQRGLFDVPDPKSHAHDDDEGSVSSAEEVVLGGGEDSTDVNNVAVQTASHYISFLDILDSICNCFLCPGEHYLDSSSSQAPALSRGELGKQVGMLYMNANSLGSLGRPTDDLAPPKLASKPSLQKMTSFVDSTTAAPPVSVSVSASSSTSVGAGTTATAAVAAVSPVHLLATRLMFMGYLKSHVLEILQKVESGNMNPLGRLKDDDPLNTPPDVGEVKGNTDAKEDQSGEKDIQHPAMPSVPLSANPFNWLSYDEDSVPPPQESKSRRSSSATRVRTAASSPNYSITGLRNFYLEFKTLFNHFLAVRCEFYQNVGISNIAKSIAFLNELDDFSTKYYIVELEELMKSYEDIAKQRSSEPPISEGIASQESSPVKVKGDTNGDHGDDKEEEEEEEEGKEGYSRENLSSDDLDVEAKGTLDTIVEAASPSIVLSTKTILTHLCTNKTFNNLMTSNMTDLRVMSFLCMPEWVCGKQDMLSACQRMKQEIKYALQTSMINEYHKNLMQTLEKHNKVYDEVVQASFSSRAEPKLLLAAVDANNDEAEDKNDLSSGHNLLHLWFCHRFKEANVNDGIPMDSIVFEFLKEDVFATEESARSFFEALDAKGTGVLSFRQIMDGALSNTYEERYFLETFIMKLRRRNSLRKSLSTPLSQEEDEREKDKEMDELGVNEEDDIHFIHEAFLQFYFKTVMTDNQYLDNLVKAVPHLGKNMVLTPSLPPYPSKYEYLCANMYIPVLVGCVVLLTCCRRRRDITSRYNRAVRARQVNHENSHNSEFWFFLQP